MPGFYRDERIGFQAGGEQRRAVAARHDAGRGESPLRFRTIANWGLLGACCGLAVAGIPVIVPAAVGAFVIWCIVRTVNRRDDPSYARRGMKTVDCTRWWTDVIRLMACFVLAYGVFWILSDTVFHVGCITGEGIPGSILAIFASIVLKLNPRKNVELPDP